MPADGVRPVIMTGAGGKYPPGVAVAAIPNTAATADSTTAVLLGQSGTELSCLGFLVSVAAGAAAAGLVRFVSSGTAVRLSADIQFGTSGLALVSFFLPGQLAVSPPLGEGVSVYNTTACTLSAAVFWTNQAQVAPA